jgi:hypothetical protein
MLFVTTVSVGGDCGNNIAGGVTLIMNISN